MAIASSAALLGRSGPDMAVGRVAPVPPAGAGSFSAFAGLKGFKVSEVSLRGAFGSGVAACTSTTVSYAVTLGGAASLAALRLKAAVSRSSSAAMR